MAFNILHLTSMAVDRTSAHDSMWDSLRLCATMTLAIEMEATPKFSSVQHMVALWVCPYIT